MRQIMNAHAGRPFNAGNALDQLDPVNANNLNDVHYDRPACKPKYIDFPPMHRDRVGRLTQAFRVRQNNFMEASLCWNGQLFQHFVLFMQKAKSVISVGTLPTTTAGTAAYLAWATPEDGDDAFPPTTFFYFANTKLSGAEQHAARLFRYRQSRPRDENCSEPGPARIDRQASFLASPPTAQPATMTISDVRDYNSYVGHYVRHFMSK